LQNRTKLRDSTAEGAKSRWGTASGSHQKGSVHAGFNSVLLRVEVNRIVNCIVPAQASAARARFTRSLSGAPLPLSQNTLDAGKRFRHAGVQWKKSSSAAELNL